MVMTRRKLLRAIDAAKVQAAVEEAERRTSGEIVISVSTIFWGDVENGARRAFARLGVSNTRDRNGILIFVVPSRRRFMVLGDTAIHERVGEEFWTFVAGELSVHFRRGLFTEGLVRDRENWGTTGHPLSVRRLNRPE
jgi:uncharacterized membrane protein